MTKMKYVRIPDKERFRIDGIPYFEFPTEHIVNFVAKKLLEPDRMIFATNGQSFRAGSILAVDASTLQPIGAGRE